MVSSERRSQAIDEAGQRRAPIGRVTAVVGRLTEQLTPNLLSTVTFLAGVILLCSGATPAAAGRLARLDPILSLGVIELSHFLASVLGAALLILSQGLARRLDAAYYVTASAMVAGIAASLCIAYRDGPGSRLATRSGQNNSMPTSSGAFSNGVMTLVACRSFTKVGKTHLHYEANGEGIGTVSARAAVGTVQGRSMIVRAHRGWRSGTTLAPAAMHGLMHSFSRA